MSIAEHLFKWVFRPRKTEEKPAPEEPLEPAKPVDAGEPAELERPGISRELIDDICSGCCSSDHYCTLKEILIRVPRDARTLIQIKCIEKLKYERSVEESRGVDWDEALDIWINEGFAERFARAYRDNIRLADLYPAIHDHASSDA
jgi:hypothetical protein